MGFKCFQNASSNGCYDYGCVGLNSCLRSSFKCGETNPCIGGFCQYTSEKRKQVDEDSNVNTNSNAVRMPVQSIISNGDFEGNNLAGWNQVAIGFGVFQTIGLDNGIAPFGNFQAYCNSNGTFGGSLYQDFNLTKKCEQYKLRYSIAINSYAPFADGTNEYNILNLSAFEAQFVRVQITDIFDNVLHQFFTTKPGDPQYVLPLSDSYRSYSQIFNVHKSKQSTHASLNLITFPEQLRLRFRLVATQGQMDFYADNVSIVQDCDHHEEQYN